MKRIHPNVSRALIALAVLNCVAGCRSQSGGMANPFLAPNRVPPPATRALGPGQAQPYYPGDPLPVMQSNTAPSSNADAIAASPPTMPSADSNLNWGSPSGTHPPEQKAPESYALASASEPTVAIPTDADALRYALPPAAGPAPFTPDNATPMPIPHSPSQLAAVVPTNANANAVVPASYAEPTPEIAPQFATAQEQTAPSPAAFNPWRTPTIASAREQTWPRPAMSPIAAQPIAAQPIAAQPIVNQPIAIPAPPLFASPNMMAVNLRAVPSPLPVAPTTPRIRMPGEIAAQTANSRDGFRPRSSMR